MTNLTHFDLIGTSSVEYSHSKLCVFAINGLEELAAAFTFRRGGSRISFAISINKMRSQYSLIYFAQNNSFTCEIIIIRGFD